MKAAQVNLARVAQTGTDAGLDDRKPAAANGQVARFAVAAGLMWLACAVAAAGEQIDVAGPQGLASDATGNIYVADLRAHVIRRIAVSGETAILAGSPGDSGSDDGIGFAASFNGPASVGVDSAGNVFVADANNHAIRRITPAGVVTTFAGKPGVAGSRDGECSQATFNNPHGIAIDPAGNVYVADTDNSTIRRITPECRVSTLAGTVGAAGSKDGSGGAATFSFPQDLATDRLGNVYVSDINAHVIRKITPDGEVRTLAGAAGLVGNDDGHAGAARFNYPKGIATDPAGNVFVVDSNNYAIRRITPEGEVSTVIGQTEAAMTLPAGVAIRGTSLFLSLYSGATLVRDLPLFVMTGVADSQVASAGQ